MVAGPVEELESKLPLEHSNSAAERWLRNTEPACGAAEMQLFCHSDEIPKLLELQVLLSLQCLAERWLRNIKPPRGAAKMQLPYHGHGETAQLLEFQGFLSLQCLAAQAGPVFEE